MNDLMSLLCVWPPDKTQAAPALFDRPARLDAARRLPSQKAMNRRRTLSGPGSYPPAKPTDPKIPIIALATRSQSQTKNSNSLGSWTILLPWKCVLPVWYLLMYYPLSSGGNLRFGGLKEQQQLAFEAGEPWFPGDFPGTRAGWEWNLIEREQAKTEWERRPKGRRIEYDSLDLGNGKKGEVGRGWACDWEELLQLSSGHAPPAQKEGQKTGDDGKGDESRIDAAVSGENGSNESAMIERLPPDMYQLCPTVAETMLNRAPNSRMPQTQVALDNGALATVKISLVHRGTPTPRARLYRLPTTDDKLREKWLRMASRQPTTSDFPAEMGENRISNAAQEKSDPPSHSQRKHKQKPGQSQVYRDRQQLAASLITPTRDSTAASADHLPLPREEDLIGFVTTGNYNLAEGRATAIGSILMAKALGQDSCLAPDNTRKPRETRMCIVRPAGERVGRLAYWEVV